MKVQYENKKFYILLKYYDNSVHGGIIEAKTMGVVEKKVLLSNIKMKINPWIELKGIDEEGNYNNTCHMINMRNVGMVRIFESKDEYLEYKKEENTKNLEKKSEKIKLKDFLTLTRKSMFVEIINNHGSEGALRAEELLAKRPELEETYIQTNGIECRMEVLDYFLAYNSDLRKDEFFEGRKNEDYLYLLIYVED